MMAGKLASRAGFYSLEEIRFLRDIVQTGARSNDIQLHSLQSWRVVFWTLTKMVSIAATHWSTSLWKTHQRCNRIRSTDSLGLEHGNNGTGRENDHPHPLL